MNLEGIDEDIRGQILRRDMGRFIWVGELSSKKLIAEDMITGLVLLDATEPVHTYHKHLIIAFNKKNMIYYDTEGDKFGKKDIVSQSFLKFNNLKYYPLENNN
jgi:hypothetical protein